jgi:hypothetical protein
MLTKTKLSLTALAIVASAAIAAPASAATHHVRHHAPVTQEFIDSPVSLPYGYSSQTEGPYSGPFRTDSAPITGGGY